MEIDQAGEQQVLEPEQVPQSEVPVHRVSFKKADVLLRARSRVLPETETARTRSRSPRALYGYVERQYYKHTAFMDDRLTVLTDEQEANLNEKFETDVYDRLALEVSLKTDMNTGDLDHRRMPSFVKKIGSLHILHRKASLKSAAATRSSSAISLSTSVVSSAWRRWRNGVRGFRTVSWREW